jgi:hypothetical protein
VTLIAVAALRSAGLRLDPTGRNPRHFDIILDDLHDGLARLVGCPHQTIVDPYP